MSVTDAFMIIIDDSRVMLQIVASLTDYSRAVIYNRNVFILLATDVVLPNILLKNLQSLLWQGYRK